MSYKTGNFLAVAILVFSISVSGISCRNGPDLKKNKGAGNSPLTLLPEGLKAGMETIIEITLTVPEGGIAAGGSILFPFYMKPWNGLLTGISDDKSRNNLVSASRSDGGELDLINVPVNREFDILSNLKAVIREKPVAAGEKITFHFGTPGHMVSVQRKQVSFYLEVEMDAAGNGGFKRLLPPLIPVSESAPTSLFLTAPSQAIAGEEFKVVVYAEDKFHNACENYTGELIIHKVNSTTGEDVRYQMRRLDSGIDLDRNEFPFTVEKEGIYYLEAVDEVHQLSAISNPIEVTATDPVDKVRWGEIHVHSQLSDGRGELQDVYRDGYARGLDFVAITDHGFGRGNRGTQEERIREICLEAERFNRPGKFITIPAGESHAFPVMHMNFYFDEAKAEQMLDLLEKIDGATADLRKDWQGKSDDQLRRDVKPYWDVFRSPEFAINTLVFPHHTMWLGIKSFLDPERMRVIEIFSTHGTSETRNQNNIPLPLKMKPDRIAGNQDRKFPVIELLDEGMRLGFTGGSDNHDGQAGMNSITGVYVNELTRKAIVRSIFDQQCYATSANRTLIKVIQEGSSFKFFVYGDGEIDQVVIVRNGMEVYIKNEINERVFEFNWLPADSRKGYFYLRTTLNNGEDAAWSSPVWLD